VTGRYKVVTIDKKLLLPVGIRSYQEMLGKIQDLDYRIKNIHVNNASYAYDFSAQRFPQEYTREARYVNKKLLAMLDNPSPAFALKTFDDRSVSTAQLGGKVVLLDFWEVWCGPCIASMPKVQSLYENYKTKGLEVYGLMSEKDQLAAARLLVQKTKIDFPMLVADQQLLKAFGINAVPTYILIDKKGNIRFTSEGFSEQIENEIKKLL
jgi:thiol-disulfide isomerase/thioredoxin